MKLLVCILVICAVMACDAYLDGIRAQDGLVTVTQAR